MLLRVRRDRALAAAQEGLNTSWEHADDSWKRTALECLLWIAVNFPTVTSEDVWLRLQSKHPEAETHENSAMGGVFTTAASHGWIVNTGRRQQATRESNHRDITVWASMLYLGRDAVEVTSCPACEGHGTLLEVVDRHEPLRLDTVGSPRSLPSVQAPAPDGRALDSMPGKRGGRGAQSKKAVERPQRPNRFAGMTEDEMHDYKDKKAGL